MHIKKYRPSSDLTISKHFSRPFFQLQNEIDRLFDDVFSDFGSFVQPSRDLITRDSSFVPSLNFAESSKEYTVMVDIPGVDEKNIKIEASNGTLSITGEKNFEAEDKDKNFYRMERSYGSFERRLAIPDDAKEDDISAEFKNGVLQIKIPRDKEKESKVKKIDIKKR